MSLEILVVFVLILANGAFAMSEIAVVSSRRSRLRQRADAGDPGARRALDMAEHPNRFLSTVQIGITLIGVFAGAYGGASIAGKLAQHLDRFPALAGYTEEISLGIVVLTITYLSLVIGELVPKRIALTHPERVAMLVAGPMSVVSMVASPVVRVLSVSTDFLLRLLRVEKGNEPPVTEDEISALLEAGTQAGVFEEDEHELVERVFWLGDQQLSVLMTPRHRIEWLDIHDPPEIHAAEIVRSRLSRYLVCDGDLDHVLGMVQVKDLVSDLLEARPIDLRAAIRKPLFVPEGLRALRLLEMFRESGTHLAVVIDEYGGVEGLVTLDDVLEEITGSLALDSEPGAIQREDGSWLVDGSLTMVEFWETLGLEDRREDNRGDYHTLGGLVVTELGRIPQSGDAFDAHGLRFEVVDMDGHRVDKVLVSDKVPEAGGLP